jgi:BlaI family penicillinase repressor
MKKRPGVLGPQELQIMNVVWDRGRVTVRDVYQDLLERRQVAYTTVMTMMGILEQKGFLRKIPGADRAYVYEPARSRKAVLRKMVSEFVERVFAGSANPLMVHLLEDEYLTPKDLDDLRKSIRKKGEST